MSLFAELKRRNVFRVGLAYVVAGWLVLQVTDVLMQLLGLPAVTGKVVFAVVALGFIPALAFAWAYELTPEGLKRDSEVRPEESAAHVTAHKLDKVTIGLLVAVVLVVVADRMIPERGADTAAPVAATVPADTGTGTGTDAGPDASAEAGNATRATAQAGSVDVAGAAADGGEQPASGRTPSVAVLPFANMSPDPDNEYFADGISEELLNLLVDVDGLRVPSRTSSFAFKGQNRDIRDIAAELEVGHVVEGSVRKAGNRVRITAQLIDVSTDTHLWSETYDRELEDIFAIQDEIAGHIVEQLKLALALDETRQPTKDLEAYTLYLQGRELMRQRGESLREAVRLLRRAVELDPQFAEAWSDLALTYVNLPAYLNEDRDVEYPRAMEAAERALAIDPDQAGADLAIAQVANSQGRRLEALDRYEEAVRRHPKHSLARGWYAVALLEAGYAERALEQMAAAVELDPAYGVVLDWYARTALVAGRTDEVDVFARRAMQLGRELGIVPLQFHALAEGEFQDLDPYFGEAASYAREFSKVLFDLRDGATTLDEALSWAERLEREGLGFQAAYLRMSIQMIAGTPQAFFDSLRTIQSFDSTAPTAVWMPPAARHRASPEMIEWAREIGLADVWRERGWPPFCQPTTGDDFECE